MSIPAYFCDTINLTIGKVGDTTRIAYTKGFLLRSRHLQLGAVHRYL